MSSPRKSSKIPGQPSPAPAVSARAADWVARCDLGLSEAEQAEFSEWSAQEENQQALARTSRLWSLLELPRKTGAADSLVAELDLRARRRIRRRRMLCAAAGAMAIAALFGYWREFPRSPAPAVQLAAAESPVRQQKLVDGSTLDFKADAAIDVHFSPAMRRVDLVRGEVLFHVSQNPARPFVVAAGGVEVRAVGTAFSVRFDPEKIDVLVTEGRVAVGRATSGAIATAAQPLCFVDAGHHVVLSRPAAESDVAPQVEAVTASEIDRRLAWRYPRLEFFGTRLNEAVAMFNRHSETNGGKRLVIGDADLAELEVSGYFRPGNVDGFVRLLEVSFGVKAEPGSAGEIVLRRAN